MKLHEQIKEFLETYHLTSQIQGANINLHLQDNVDNIKEFSLSFKDQPIITSQNRNRAVNVGRVRTLVSVNSKSTVVRLYIPKQHNINKKLADFYNNGADVNFDMRLYALGYEGLEYRLLFREFEYYQKFILSVGSLLENNNSTVFEVI